MARKRKKKKKKHSKSGNQELLLVAATNPRARLRRLGGAAAMEIGDLGLVERDLGVASIVVDLHRFDVGCGYFAERALQFGVTALVETGAIGLTGFPSAAVGGGGINLSGDLLRRVLLRLRFSSHSRRC